MRALVSLFVVLLVAIGTPAAKRPLKPCKFGDKIEYGHLGKEVKIGDELDAYVSHPNETETKGGVIVIQDIFGWNSSNTRAMVDMLMENGYTTILPDSFEGKDVWQRGGDWTKFGQFFAERQPKNIGRVVNASIDYMRNGYGIEKFGLVGFCWGGQAVHYMMAYRDDLVAGVSCYGIMSDDDEKFGELNNPTLFIFGAEDQAYSPKARRNLRRSLRSKASASYSIRSYKNQGHAFVHRKLASPDDPNKEQIYAARKKMIRWLNKHMGETP